MSWFSLTVEVGLILQILTVMSIFGKKEKEWIGCERKGVKMVVITTANGD